MKKNLLVPILGVLLCLWMASCVKDTDFDQAENITLTPVVELDLIYFDLDAADFYNDETNPPRLTVSDTTEIRFLDDTEIQESLKKAEFLFVFTNTIPRSFQADFQFLDVANETTYATSTTVAEGSPENAVVSEFTETVEGNDILALTQADKVVVSLTLPSSDVNLEGSLNLKSKTTYYLEIKERN